MDGDGCAVAFPCADACSGLEVAGWAFDAAVDAAVVVIVADVPGAAGWDVSSAAPASTLSSGDGLCAGLALLAVFAGVVLLAARPLCGCIWVLAMPSGCHCGSPGNGNSHTR